MSTLGDRIKEKRIAAGFSADELAKRIGKNRATVYRYESGDVDGLGEIAKVFTSLTPDNRAKLLELSRLYLAAQGSNE